MLLPTSASRTFAPSVKFLPSPSRFTIEHAGRHHEVIAKRAALAAFDASSNGQEKTINCHFSRQQVGTVDGFSIDFPRHEEGSTCLHIILRRGVGVES